MNVNIIPSVEFDRHFKRLAKKYKSLLDDYLTVLVSENADVTLLTIYDKNEIDNVSDEYIRWLVSEATTCNLY